MPIETLKAGSLGTLSTLSLARERRARYLLASTSEVYGDPQVHPQPETYVGHVNPLGPRSPYNEAKRFAEALVMAHRSIGVDTSIARIFNTYGPRMCPDDGRLVPTFIRQALRQQSITVTGDGRQTRSFQYVDDCVEGCLRLLHSRECRAINIGSTDEISILALGELIRDLAGSASEFAFVPRPDGDPTLRRPDIGLAKRLLDWSPVVGLEEGLNETLAWFRSLPST